MPNKPGKLKPARLDRVREQKLVMRFAEIRESTADESSRSVEAVIATENPVQRYDAERDLVLREVLVMDGIELRGGRNQLPIVDSHDRSTVRNILGSVRNIRVEGDELVGRAYFAKDEESQRAYEKLIDGHINDFSITASPLEVRFLERGQSYETRRNETVEGPADIVTRWMPTDASLVATGADERSVVRRSYTEIPTEIERMDESQLKPLVDMGMPAEITEPSAVIAWVVGHMASKASQQAEPSEEIESAETEVSEMTEPVENMSDEKPADELENEMSGKEEIQKALQAERSRVREINAMAEKHSLDREFVKRMIDSDDSIDVCRKKVLDEISRGTITVSDGANPGDDRIRFTGSEDDKFFAAAKAGMTERALQSSGVGRVTAEAASKVEGASDFKNLGLFRTAEQFVRRMGCNTDRMNRRDIAMVALGQPAAIERHRIERASYHTTGSFSNLLLDAANKTLLAGYEEAPFTWSQWARQATSVPDFKNINRIRFSEFADLQHVPETKEYKEGQMSDSKESYNVEKFGRLFTVSWETVVNDDLDAISRIPAMQGSAARRVQNKKIYEVLTANANMSDGNPLFDESNHLNADEAAGAAPSVTTLNTAFSAMMKQTGLDGSTTLNLQPAHLIVPVALSATAMQLLGSIADPSAGGSSAGNSNTHNVYGPNGQRPLNLVVEPQLDGNSTTAWYLAASNSQIDTVEITFLEGEEAPVLENEWDFDTDCYKYKVRQTFGVKAIDWRGLYYNVGT